MSAHHFDLMLQQTELNYLLLDTAKFKLDDITSSDADPMQFDTYFLKLIESKENGDQETQWNMHMEVRLKLKEYSM